MYQAGGSSGLSEEELDVVREPRHELRAEHLQSTRTPQARMPGSVDARHPALASEALDEVEPESAADQSDEIFRL